MKKAPGGILILVLILLMGSPWYVGMQVETFYNQVTEETLRKNPTLDLTDLNFQRGWFSSTLTGGIAIKTLGQEPKLPFEVRYKSEITHGPVFWSALSSTAPVGLALDATTIWLEPTGDDEKTNAMIRELPSFEMRSVIGFQKIIDSAYSIAAYAKTIQTETKPVNFNFEGLRGSATLDWGSKDFSFNLAMPALTVTENEAESLTIDSVELSGYKRGGDSNVRYDIAGIALKSQESNIHFNLDKPYLSGSNIEVGEVCNAALESGFDSLSANELTYAPAKLHIRFDNLDKKALASLRETINEAANADDMGSEMYGTIVMGKLIELLPDILKRDPKLTLVTLNLGTGQGEAVTASGYAAIIGKKAANLPSMLLISQALDARFEAALPKAFLNTFLDLGRLMELLNQGFLVSDGKYYRIEATVQEGHLTINGTPLM